MNLCFRSRTRLQMFLLVSSSYVGVPQRDSNMASPTKLCKYIVWDEIFVGVYFCGLAIFLCFCGSSLFFAIRKQWFFLLGINFRDFQKLADPGLIKFSFLLSTFVRATELNTPNKTHGVSILYKTSNKLYTVLFLKERDKVVIEQKQNLGIVFLCSEFMLENIYSAVVCGNFFCGSLEKLQKSQTKIRNRATRYMKGEPFLSKMVYACIKLGVGPRCGASPFVTSLSVSPRSNDRHDVVLNGDRTKKKKRWSHWVSCWDSYGSRLGR